MAQITVEMSEMSNTNASISNSGKTTRSSSKTSGKESKDKSGDITKKHGHDTSAGGAKTTSAVALSKSDRPEKSVSSKGGVSKNTAKLDPLEAIMQKLDDIQSHQNEQDQKIDSLLVEEPYGNFSGFQGGYHNLSGSDQQDFGDDHVMDFEEQNVSSAQPHMHDKMENDDSDILANSMFASFTKRYSTDENCDNPVDKDLAGMVNQFFREGISEEKLQELVRDNPRPQNCEGLSKIKVNQLVWNIIPPHTRSADVASQNLQQSIIKGATILTKLVDKLSANSDTSLVESGLDVLALLGQANKQLVQRRREALKPVIQSDFGHLCSTSVPYTNMLFGDDVSKNVKDIQDMERLKKMVKKSSFGPSHSHRGGRFNPYPRSRGRGFRGRGSFRGNRPDPNWHYGQNSWTKPRSAVSKSHHKKD